MVFKNSTNELLWFRLVLAGYKMDLQGYTPTGLFIDLLFDKWVHGLSLWP